MSLRQPLAAGRVLAVTAVVTAAALALSSCGIVRDLQADDHPGPDTIDVDPEEDPRPEVEAEFPYTREGTIFQDTGQDSTLRFAINGLERTDEYTVIHYEETYVDHFRGIVSNLSMPNTLIDPVSGRAYAELTDQEGYYYGSVPPTTGSSRSPWAPPTSTGATSRACPTRSYRSPSSAAGWGP